MGVKVRHFNMPVIPKVNAMQPRVALDIVTKLRKYGIFARKDITWLDSVRVIFGVKSFFENFSLVLFYHIPSGLRI